MSTSTIKGLLAGLATVAVIGTALAQSNPPNPAVANPATGAGQQSSQGTPMGMTGTPGTGGTVATTPAPKMATTTGSGSTMGATTGTTKMAAASPTRRVRADRN
jgi:hypothetical protein